MRGQDTHTPERAGGGSGNPPVAVRVRAVRIPEARAVRAPASRYARFAKAALDRLLAAVLVVVLAPVLLVVAAAVWRALGRPVVLRQTRVGRDGKPFSMYKFRTMLLDRRTYPRPIDRPERRLVHKHPDDPRHTRLGRFLRAASLDELPQLLNVVRGDMSLVGPRPELAEIVAGYEDWQHARHAVKPGLTGLWQITQRGPDMHRHTKVDLDYIEQLSFRTDLRILLRTIPALLSRRGF